MSGGDTKNHIFSGVFHKYSQRKPQSLGLLIIISQEIIFLNRLNIICAPRGVFL